VSRQLAPPHTGLACRRQNRFQCSLSERSWHHRETDVITGSRTFWQFCQPARHGVVLLSLSETEYSKMFLSESIGASPRICKKSSIQETRRTNRTGGRPRTAMRTFPLLAALWRCGSNACRPRKGGCRCEGAVFRLRSLEMPAFAGQYRWCSPT